MIAARSKHYSIVTEFRVHLRISDIRRLNTHTLPLNRSKQKQNIQSYSGFESCSFTHTIAVSSSSRRKIAVFVRTNSCSGYQIRFGPSCTRLISNVMLIMKIVIIIKATTDPGAKA